MPISSRIIASILSPYGGPISEQHCFKIFKYIDLLNTWNRKVSLTSVSGDEAIVRIHFGESLSGLSFVGEGEGRLADVGSGAGFPGLVIALFRPNLRVSLIEPNKKKSAFLSEAIRSLELRNASVLSVRYEDARIEEASLDYVTSRALGNLENVLRWSSCVLKKSGKIILWTVEGATANFAKSEDWHWERSVQIPHTKKRVVAAGIKAR